MGRRLRLTPPDLEHAAMDLSDPVTFGRIYDEHRRSVHATALPRAGELGSGAGRGAGRVPARLAQPAEVRRQPRRGRQLPAADGPQPRASTCGARAQASGRAEDRLKVVVAQDGRGPATQPDHLALARPTAPTSAPRCGRLPVPQREALVLAYWGGLTADQIATARRRAARHRQEPHPARPRASARRAEPLRADAGIAV